MKSYATFTVTGQQEPIHLAPGDFIGRSYKASLILSDPRISEAHAMLSLRGQSLKLLALRGRFRHEGQVLLELDLKPGQAIELAKDIWLNCVEVCLPKHIPALRINQLPPVVLTNTISIFLTADPYIKQGVQPQADAMIWSSGDSWHITFGDGPSQRLNIGDQWAHDDHLIHVLDITRREEAQLFTRSHIQQPLTLNVVDQRVHIHNEVDPPVIISGVPGKILAALLRQSGSAHWTAIARQVWLNDKAGEDVLRPRFDVGLGRLRQQMKALFNTEDALLEFDGTGILSIHLSKQDTILFS